MRVIRGVKVEAFFDGSCNSSTEGKTGIGVVVLGEGKTLVEVSEPSGRGTNNTAEYNAVIRALEESERLGADEAEVFGDSELVIRQLRGEYKVRKEHLRPLHAKALELARNIGKVTFNWIPREKNEQANYLAQKAVFG